MRLPKRTPHFPRLGVKNSSAVVCGKAKSGGVDRWHVRIADDNLSASGKDLHYTPIDENIQVVDIPAVVQRRRVRSYTKMQPWRGTGGQAAPTVTCRWRRDELRTGSLKPTHMQSG